MNRGIFVILGMILCNACIVAQNYVGNDSVYAKLCVPADDSVLVTDSASYVDSILAADSISSVELQEVVVKASKVIHKSDMDVYYPSKIAISNSRNGVQLLSNLLIPSLTVNDMLGKIQSGNIPIELRINGRVATMEQVKALLPETVKRVEWIDNPWLRYNGVNKVLNLIVSNPSLGGSLMVEAQPVLNQKFGKYFLDAKFNNGYSQWSIGGRFKLTEDIKMHRDYEETFTYPDGKSLKRTEIPESGEMDNSQGSAWISYSYIRPDTTIFYISLDTWRNFSDKYLYNGILTLDNSPDQKRLSDSHGTVGTTPSLSAYFEHHFARKQTLVIDASASMYAGHTSSYHRERNITGQENLQEFCTNIKDRNKAFGIEADYIKSWKYSHLTAGISYTLNRNRSTYLDLDGDVYHQCQDKFYLFAEYYQRVGNFTLNMGTGAQYSSFKFRETGLGRHSWNFRPQATLTYSPSSNHQLRLSFTSQQTSPTLDETTNVMQQIDGVQWTIGNPELKTYTSYILSIRYSFSSPRVNGTFSVDGASSPDNITPYLYWENNRLITTYENSRGLQNLTVRLSPQVELIPDWLTAAGMLQYSAERQKGRGYKLYNHSWCGNAVVMLTHWGFTLSAQYVKANRSLYGQRIRWGEDISIIDLKYNYKNWEFGAGILMPFGKYDQGSKLISKWNKNEQHMRLNMRMPYITIGYNLEWGRTKRGVKKLVSNGSSVQKSNAASR